MDNQNESVVVRQFRERVAQGDIRGIRVTYRVSGGVPAEGRVEEMLQVSGEGTGAIRSLTGRTTPQETSARISDDEIRRVFEQLAQGFDSLVTRSEARFIPDSLVGSITIDIAGNQETRYFNVEEEAGARQSRFLAAPAAEAVSELDRISERLRKEAR